MQVSRRSSTEPLGGNIEATKYTSEQEPSSVVCHPKIVKRQFLLERHEGATIAG